MNTSVIFFLLFPQGKGVEDTRPDSFVVSETHDTLDTPTVTAEVLENLTDTLLMLISWRVVLFPPGMSFNLAVSSLCGANTILAVLMIEEYCAFAYAA
ncbi:hypothetical protein D5086_027507 [Populus alba]|uniref:Uncharacterized protein n=1 Tax=Populus alba TaxID=43335 RepID=A0ACC4AWU5_POPAL